MVRQIRVREAVKGQEASPHWDEVHPETFFSETFYGQAWGDWHVHSIGDGWQDHGLDEHGNPLVIRFDIEEG